MNSKSMVAIGVVAVFATLVVATFAVAGHNAFAFGSQHQRQHVGCGDTCVGIQQQNQQSGGGNNHIDDVNVGSRGADQ
ncbi:MAG TPA: hypothetical protein VH500_22940 [Nitrososphaeraceae archaeon]